MLSMCVFVRVHIFLRPTVITHHHAPSCRLFVPSCPVLNKRRGVTGGRWWTQIDGFIRVKKFIQTHFVCFQCPAPSIGRFVKVTETDIPKYNDTAPRPIAPQLAAKKKLLTQLGGYRGSVCHGLILARHQKKEMSFTNQCSGSSPLKNLCSGSRILFHRHSKLQFENTTPSNKTMRSLENYYFNKSLNF